MSDSERTAGQGPMRLYLEALRAVAGHLLPRLKVFRRAYERIVASRTLPVSVKSVLFLCKGNICRSPLADVYFTHKVRTAGAAIVVRSAGIETTPGKPAHQLAKEVALSHGISLDAHRTTPLYQDLVQQADLVMVMEVAQKDRVIKLYPEARTKVFVLGQFCRQGSWDIDDPYSGTVEDFTVCFERIRDSCDRVFHHLVELQSAQPVASPASLEEGASTAVTSIE